MLLPPLNADSCPASATGPLPRLCDMMPDIRAAEQKLSSRLAEEAAKHRYNKRLREKLPKLSEMMQALKVIRNTHSKTAARPAIKESSLDPNSCTPKKRACSVDDDTDHELTPIYIPPHKRK